MMNHHTTHSTRTPTGREWPLYFSVINAELLDQRMEMLMRQQEREERLQHQERGHQAPGSKWPQQTERTLEQRPVPALMLYFHRTLVWEIDWRKNSGKFRTKWRKRLET